jgi:peptide chain release factor subunit 1
MDISSLRRLHSDQGSLVSLFLNHPPGPAASALSDLLKAIRAAAERMERAAAVSVKGDAERIAGLAARMDVDPAASFAVFASQADGIFEYLPLKSPVWDHASVGRRPYLRPLRAAPRPLRAGVVVADRRQARVFVAENGDLAQVGDVIEGDPGKANYGGWHGLEEHRVRGRADEEASRVWGAAAARLFEEHRRKPFDLVGVGGHHPTNSDLTAALHPYLRALPGVELVVDPHTMTPAVLKAMVDTRVAEVRGDGERRLVERVLEAVGAGVPSARGTADVLTAVNAKAVHQLVVAGPFSKPGVACPGCGWLGRTGTECPLCTSRLDEVDDVIAEAIEAVLAAGGAVDQVAYASSIDAEGVVALLRFPV